MKEIISVTVGLRPTDEKPRSDWAEPACMHTRKPCYRKDHRAMRPMYTYKLFTLILFTLTVTILCADFDSERI